MILPDSQYYRSLNGKLEYKLFTHFEGSDHLMVIFHGLGGSSSSAKYLFNEPENKAHILGISLPFHGETVLSNPLSANYAELNKLILGLIDELKKQLEVAKLTLCGHSIGALFALQLTLDAPKIADKLLLLCPAGFGEKDKLLFRLICTPFFQNIMKVQLFSHAIARRIYTPSDGTKKQRNLIYDAIARLLRSVHEYDLSLTKRIHLLYNVATKVVVVWAKDDRTLPFQNAAEVKNHFQRATIQLLDTGGHNLLKNRPTKIISLVNTLFG